MPYKDPLMRAENAAVGIASIEARRTDAKTLSLLRGISVRRALKELPPLSAYRRKTVPIEPPKY